MTRNEKKGLSPIIATILLILLAIVLASIILLWARGFIKETPLKFDPSLNEDRPIQELCDKVILQAVISQNSIAITNTGSIPVNKLKITASASGSSDQEEQEINLDPGSSKVITTNLVLANKKVEIAPILLGKMKSGETVPFPCFNNAQTIE